MRWVARHWAVILFVLFSLTVIALIAVRPQMEMGEDDPAPAAVGLEHLPGAAEPSAEELEAFVARSAEEVNTKGTRDQVRMVILATIFMLVLLSFYRGRRIGRLREFSAWLRNLWDTYTFGTVTGLLLLVLVIPTGTIITLFFSTQPEGLYESVEAISSNWFLAFMRNLHLWSSELFLVIMLLHVARVISTGTYFARRKIIWVFGVVMLAITWTTYLMGTFLRGDQEAFEAWVHLMAVLRMVPVAGAPIADFFSGEFAVMKLLVFHIAITTILLLVIIAPHVLMRKTYVHVQQRWKTAVKYFTAITAALVVESILLPAPFLGSPLHDIEITKPPWPYYVMYGTENFLGATSMVWSGFLVVVPMLLLPYVLEQLNIKRGLASKLGNWVFYTGALLVIAFTFWTAAAPVQAHLFA